jgi:(E)-4-hydroxy-3-methylbut-2-enyl-diphosphate synthase
VERRISRKVKVGNIYIGGDSAITVQSMLNRPASDIEGSVKQAVELEKAGCEIIRAAVPDMAAAKLIEKLKENLTVPVVADIHFDYRLALASLDAGVDKIRINPGNIGDTDRVAAVANACKQRNIPIRIGVNGGSLEKEILAKYGSPTPEALFESAMSHVRLLNKYDFDDIVVSLKASDVMLTINAYREMSRAFDYPLHLGVTEAGTFIGGTIKSAIGIGALLADGIGDTIRVSLNGDPINEIPVCKEILSMHNLYKKPTLICCPTCGRTAYNMVPIVDAIEKYLETLDKEITVAIMGCVVNGPGEAREADIGIAGGDGCAVLFKKGEILRKVSEEDIVKELLDELDKI